MYIKNGDNEQRKGAEVRSKYDQIRIIVNWTLIQVLVTGGEQENFQQDLF